MNRIIIAIDLLAIVVALGCTALAMISASCSKQYNGSIQQHLDALNGVKITFVFWPFILAAIPAWVWIVSEVAYRIWRAL